MTDQGNRRPNTGMLFLFDDSVTPQEVTLVRLVMKNARIGHDDLWQKLQELPEDKHMDRAIFDQALVKLVVEQWLWKSETDGKIIYSPRLKSNAGEPK
jgi:hypothetical protein